MNGQHPQAKADFISTMFQNLVKSGYFEPHTYALAASQIQMMVECAYQICEMAWIEEKKVINQLEKELEHERTHCGTCGAKLLPDTDEVGTPNGYLYCGLCSPKEAK